MGDNLLPPLPKTIKEYNMISSDAMVSLPPVEHDFDAADEVLQNHLLRVQEAIMNSADQKVSELDSKLRENQLVLRRSLEEKEQTGVALYRTRKEVGTLNKALAIAYSSLTRRKKVDQFAGENLAFQKEWQATERVIQDINRENHELQEALKAAQKRIEESELKVKQLHEINSNYTSEIKIQKRINIKFKKELEYVTIKAKDLENVVEKEKEKNELLHLSKKQLEQSFSQQQAEVLKSQTAINSLNSEIRELARHKAATEKQWEEALAAMSNRDKTIQAIHESKEKVETKLQEVQLIKNAYKKEQNELEKSLQKSEQERDELKRINETLQASLKQLQFKIDENQNLINQQSYSDNSYKKQIETLTKANESLERTLAKKTDEIVSIRSELQVLSAANKEAMRFQVNAEQALRREERVQLEAKQEIESIRKDAEGQSFDLRRENAKLTLELGDRKQELVELRRTHAVLQQQYQEISSHYAKLHEEAKQMIYTLERKDYDLNLFKSKASAQAEGITPLT
jgi:chromosome segregation ATPase